MFFRHEPEVPVSLKNISIGKIEEQEEGIFEQLSIDELLDFFEDKRFNHFWDDKERSRLSLTQPRAAFLNLYSDLCRSLENTDDKEKAKMMLCSALKFIMIYIRNIEYHGNDPLKQKGWLINSGSDFYTLLAEKVKCKDALLTPRLLFSLHQLQIYCKEKNIAWAMASFGNLMTDIKTTQKAVLGHDDKKIKDIETGEPVLSSLEKKAKVAQETYAAAHLKKNLFQRLTENPYHKKLAGLLQLMENTADNPFFGQTQDKKKVIQNANIFIVMFVTGEYSRFSPEGGFLNQGSALYKQCVKNGNIKPLNDYSIEQKIKILKDVNARIHEIIRLAEKDKNLLIPYNLMAEELENFETILSKLITELDHQKNTPGYFARGFEFVVRGLLTMFVAGFPLVALPMGAAISLTGAFANTAMVQYSRSRLFNKLFGRMIDRASMTITKEMQKFFPNQQKSPEENFIDLWNNESLSPKMRQEMQEFVHTLLALDDDVLSKAEKDTIRFVLDITNGFLPVKEEVKEPEASLYNGMQM